MTRKVAFFALAGYIATIFLANTLTAHYGFVPVGFGYMATAGTFAAGFAFTFRDLVQDGLGRLVVLGAIVAAAGLSFITSPASLAVASGVTFLISETCDFAVYTPLRRRTHVGAVFASNMVGLVVDSFLFLTLAGFPVNRLTVGGQILGKTWVTLASVLVILIATRVARSRRAATYA